MDFVLGCELLVVYNSITDCQHVCYVCLDEPESMGVTVCELTRLSQTRPGGSVYA